MKAYAFDEASQGVEFTITEIPDDQGTPWSRPRSSLVEALGERDEAMLNAYLEIPTWRGAASRPPASAHHRGRVCSCAVRHVAAQQGHSAAAGCGGGLSAVPAGGARRGGASHQDREPLRREASDFEPLSALAFKMANDPYVGKLIYVRLYAGVLKKGANIFNPRTRKRERIMRLLRVHANQRRMWTNCIAARSARRCGLKQVTTGDTLCAENDPILLERMSSPSR
jgi:elongation factor G